MRSTVFTAAVASILLAGASSGHSSEDEGPLETVGEPVLSVAQIHSDLDYLLNFIDTTHPKLDYTTDREELARIVAQVRSAVDRPMTAREAWAEFARLNPAFHDGHIGIRAPEAQFANYLSTGGQPFPLAVALNGDSIRVTGVPAAWAIDEQAELLSINGISSTQILRDLRPRVRGESDSLREFLIGHKFALLYWAIYGGFDEYRVVLRNPGDTVSSQVLPAAADDGIAQDPPPDPFQFQRLDQNTALLRIPSFDIALRDRFLAFLEQSFAQVAADKVTRLLIDIRENGGGARDLSDPLLSYLTDARYTPTSKVKARITAENAARVPGSQPGQVIDLPFPQWVEPTARPWRFAGELYVLIGARTYSQAIVFATIVQDFGIGKLVGEETAGLANQTGQVTKTTLPNTGLYAQAPIYIFYRAKPRIGESGVAPDITLPSDLHHPESMIDELLTRLDQGGPKSGADAQTTEHGR
jgi:hypothetical protein